MTEAEKVEVTRAEIDAAADYWKSKAYHRGVQTSELPGDFFWCELLEAVNAARHRRAHTAGDVEPVRAKLLQKADDAERVHAMFVHGITPADLRAALYAHPPAQAPTEQRQSEPSGDVAKMREALTDLEQKASNFIAAVDRYNEKHGEFIGGAPIFQLAKAVGNARIALSTLPQEQRQEAAMPGWFKAALRACVESGNDLIVSQTDAQVILSTPKAAGEDHG